MLKTLSHRAVLRKYSALPLTERPSMGYGASFPAIALIQLRSATQIRYGYQSFDGSGAWYSSREIMASTDLVSVGSVDEETTGSGAWSRVANTFSQTVSRISNVITENPWGGAVSLRRSTIFSKNTTTGAETSVFSNMEGDVWVARTIQTSSGHTAPTPVTEQRDRTDFIASNGTLISNPNETVFAHRGCQTNPYDAYYYNADAVRTVEIDESESETGKTRIVTRRHRNFVFSSKYTIGGFFFTTGTCEIDYLRDDVTEENLSNEYTERQWVEIAQGKLGAYGPQAVGVNVGSTVVTGTPSAPILTLIASKYRIQTTIPAFEKKGSYYLMWTIEDSSGVKQKRGEWIYPDEGQTVITSHEYEFMPYEVGNEWTITEAKAIHYLGLADVITQETTRDSRPLTYRDVERRYSILEKPAYLVNRIRWRLYAPVASPLEETFTTSAGWSLSQPRRTMSDELFSNSSGWNTMASGVIIESNEDFANAEGWGLSEPIPTPSDETFNNSTGWNLFAS